MQDAVNFNAGFGLEIENVTAFEGKAAKTAGYFIFGSADFRIFDEKLTFLQNLVNRFVGDEMKVFDLENFISNSARIIVGRACPADGRVRVIFRRHCVQTSQQ